MSVLLATLDDDRELAGLVASLRGQPCEIIRKEGGDPIAALNACARSAHGEVLLFTAADVRMAPRTMDSVLSEFEDAGLLALTCRADPYDGPLLCKLEYRVFYLLAFLLQRVRFVASGSFLAVRKDAFFKAGGFLPTYNNDGQLGAVLRKAGKTRFSRKLAYRVSARRYSRLGFVRFNRQFLYALEDFIPVSCLFSRLGYALRQEHRRT